MKKTITTLLLLSLSLRMTGQIDYLEPIKDYSKYKSELSGYYSNVLSLLSTGLSKKPYACYAVIRRNIQYQQKQKTVNII